MKDQTALALTCDLFQLIKQIPHPRAKQSSTDGLTRSEYELLVMLAMNLDQDRTALSVKELGHLLQITPAGVTHLINPLEEAGYIERRSAPKDRRIVLIGLTRKGSTFAHALIGEIQEQLIGLINHLGEKDSKTLIRLMSRAVKFFAADNLLIH